MAEITQVEHLIRPALSGRALLEDIRKAREDTANFHLWWLGQSGFLLQWQGRHVLLDPYLSNSLTKKYAATAKPHIRMTEIPIEPEMLDFVDVVTSSHNHTDHLDAETLRPIIKANPKVVLLVPEANRGFVSDRLETMLEFPRGIEVGKPKEYAGFSFSAVPAAHNTLECDEWGRHKCLGYVIQFGNWCVYHSGDTVLYDGLQEYLQPFRPHVALLPINGDYPERKVAGNLSGREAAKLAKDVEAGVVIPCHYEMFTFNTLPPEEFIEACTKLNQPYAVLRCGERWSSSSLPSHR